MYVLTVLSLAAACVSAIPASFDPNAAYGLLKFSSAAYQENPLNFLLKSDSGEFDFYESATVDCNLVSTCFCFVTRDKATGTVVVAFRGTNSPAQLVDEMTDVFLEDLPSSIGTGRTLAFFQDAHTLLWPQISRYVKTATRGDPKVEVQVTGHSLGGALAALTAARLSYEKITDKANLHVTTFGQPRTGDVEFANLYDSLVPNTWRVIHYKDTIPHGPPCQQWLYWEPCSMEDSFYYHHGTEVWYPDRDMTVASPRIICTGSPKNEDEGCSNGKIMDDPCLWPYPCLEDHLYYYNVNVGDERESF